MTSRSDYTPTIGLEIHAELATETKMFCSCKNDPEETRPNANVCPICMAHPGTLPVVNRKAVEQVLRVGRSIGSSLADYTEWDRKSYFYPDIPKGYQISQYEYPLVTGGELGGVALTRIHLEEDTARSSHEGADDTTSEVDFNRAGVPLMELVTEPVIHDAETAGKFARELQLLLRTLGASHANLEKGEMRIEANISISKDSTFGTKVEVKNLNSFRSVERAIEYEIARQAKVLDEGGTLEQETRGWDENGQKTFRQRTKEGSADYRYFPEPDLPKMVRSEIPVWSDEALTASLPELPWEKRERYIAAGLKEGDAELIRADMRDAEFFDGVLLLLNDDANRAALVPLAANYFISDLKGLAAKGGDGSDGLFGNVTTESFVELVRMAHAGDVSSRGAKDTLLKLFEEGGGAREVAEREGLLQVSDMGALGAAVDEVLAANPGPVAEYRAGKEANLQFLVGQAMKATKGAGNPQVLKEILVEKLKA